MSSITAVLIDTPSIQQYVFSGNRLKENIGASNIVTGIYKDSLKTSLQTVLNREAHLNRWEENPKDILIKNSDNDFEVGYIGGGKALLFFREQGKAQELIREWTKDLLLKAPGLNTAFAVSDFYLDRFQEEMEKLHKELEMNKNRCFPQTFLPKHGITADCRFSGLSSEAYFQSSKEEKGFYISSVSYTKYQNLELDEVKNCVEEKSQGRFTCATNINMLGQTRGQNHIAIVHIDGNFMGEQFKACQDLIAIRKLSKSLKGIMDRVYEKFLDYVINQMGFLKDKGSGFDLKKEDGKYIIPFRPILIAGDDITFITDGRLGLPFAEKYLELFSRENLPTGKKISACAGVAVTKTKYPFSRGYKLAEELCQSAKEQARKVKISKNGETFWLDFHVVYGGFSGSLMEIQRKKYSINNCRLHFGPYLVASEDLSKEKNIKHLKNGIKDFFNTKKWPRSMVKEFREYLTLGEKAAQYFRGDEVQIKGRQLYDLPETGRGYGVNIWRDGSTPYFDMIELLDFYPEHFLNMGQVNTDA